MLIFSKFSAHEDSVSENCYVINIRWLFLSQQTEYLSDQTTFKLLHYLKALEDILSCFSFENTFYHLLSNYSKKHYDFRKTQ